MLAEYTPMNKPNNTQSFPLAFANRGEVVIITDVRANDKLRQHLGDLGLTVGVRVRVVQADASGQVILAVKHDSRLAIGLSMAQKIMVTKLENEVQ
jgi:Fe2+ transport system protein FeoA